MKSVLRNWLFQTKPSIVSLHSWCVFTLVSVLPFKAQVANYVTNPSFEKVVSTATSTLYGGMIGWSAIDSANSGAYLVHSVGLPYYNAPNSSYGFQYPHSGDKFILSQFFCSSCHQSGRGFPRNRIKNTPKASVIYCARYYIVNTNNSPVGTSEYSILLGDSSLDTITKCQNPLPYISPQIVRQGPIITDTMNWVPISGTFVAQGHEKYLVLGNFKADANTHTTIINPTFLPTLSNDIYIDDVSLVEMELPAFAGRDTNLVPGDSVFLGREPDVGIDYACQWYLLPNDSVPIDTIAGLWVKPTVNTQYMVRQQLWCSGVKYDTVTIYFSTLSTADELQRHVRVAPNPNSGRFSISGLPASDNYDVSVADLTGRALLVKTIRVQGSVSLDLDIPEGVYCLILSGKEGRIVRKVVIEKQ